MIGYTHRPRTRAQMMADALMDQASDTSPIQSPMQGLARIGAGIAGAYKKQSNEAQRSQTIADGINVGTNQPAGLDQRTGITWNQPRGADPQAAMDVFKSNPDTADIATQMQLSKPASPSFSLGKGASAQPPPIRFNN